MPEVGKTYDIRLRYRETLSKAKIISISKTSAKLELLKKEVIDTPGQSAVLYDKEICLGGGIIE
jgi:tRNA U34 2-thiouridine synthase MnmA/TrmU